MKLNSLFSVFLIFIYSFIHAQNENRTFVKLEKTNSQIIVTTNDGFYLIKPYSNKIIET